jgi:predicted amidohydrolase
VGKEYDVLLYVASWPKTRIKAWDTLLAARAIENMSYAVGVNRIGTDDNGYEYVGHSQALDMLGAQIAEPSEAEGIYFATLNREKLLEIRAKLNFLNDQDTFEIKN